MRGNWKLWVGAVAMGISALSTYAFVDGDITYDYTDLGGGAYEFNFHVYNQSTAGEVLDFFAIQFDADADRMTYNTLAWTNDQGWISQTWEPDPGFGGLPGEVDADDSVFGGGSGAGLAAGADQDYFNVTFNYTGILAPDAQDFSWIAYFDTDPSTGDVGGEDFGTTRFVDHVIPEPTAGLLLAVAGLGMASLRRRRA